MENVSKNGRFKGQQGKVIKATDKAIKLLMFVDRKERWFQPKYLQEVVPDDAPSSCQRAPGKKAKREHNDQPTCDVDMLVMAFHKGLPAKSKVTDDELLSLVANLTKLFH